MKRVWRANPRCWGECEDTLGRMAGAGKPPCVKGVDEYVSSIPGALGALVNQQGRVDYPSGAGQGSAPVPADQFPGMVPQLPGWGPLETMIGAWPLWDLRSQPDSPCPILALFSLVHLHLPFSFFSIIHLACPSSSLTANSHIQTL